MNRKELEIGVGDIGLCLGSQAARVCRPQNAGGAPGPYESGQVQHTLEACDTGSILVPLLIKSGPRAWSFFSLPFHRMGSFVMPS